MLAGLLPATLAIAERRRLEELINELRTNVANWLEAEGTRLEEVAPEKQPPTDMSKNIGHNWRSPLDKEYDRLVDLAAVAMIGAANKPELSKHSCAYAQEAIARRGGAVEDGRYLVRDVALAVYGDVTDRAAEIYLSELRGKIPPEVMAALEREVTATWRAAFDQMAQAFPFKY